MSRIEWLSPLDAGFLQVETDTQLMHVGSLLLLDGPAPDYRDYCNHVASRLDDVPRYRQRVEHTLLDIARPYWTDDPHFSLAYHVRHTAVPHPGDDGQLRTLVGRIMSQRLDLKRPLWEMWMVEGLHDGGWAVISKVHHAMVDGVSGHEILEIMLDREQQSAPEEPADWQPRPRPTRTDLLRDASGWVARVPAGLTGAAGTAIRSPRDAMRATAVRTTGMWQVGRRVVGPSGPLSGSIGPHRRWSWARADLARVKLIKDAAGCTVNDVVLATIAGAFRQFFIHRGEILDEVAVRSLVPVSVRTPEQSGRLGNQVSAMFADLPVHLDDPMERLAAVAEQMQRLKSGGEAIGVGSLVSAAEFVPPTLITLAARVSVAVGQRVFNTVTTNIPGPQYPLYLLGSRLREMFPYIPIADGARVSIGIVSYAGSLAFAATGDYDAIPDLDDLCRDIEGSLDELVAAVGQ